MFSTNDHPLQPGSYAVFAHELRPGALEGRLPQWLIGEVAAESTVILVRTTGEVEILTADPALQAQLEQRSER